MAGRRVLVLPKWYPSPEQPVFGLFCREHARAAALAGNDVRVLAFTARPDLPDGNGTPEGGGDGGARAGRLYRLHDDPHEPLPTTRLDYLRPRVRPAAMATQLLGMRAALSAFARDGWEPELIHAHVFSAGFPAVLLGRRLGVPVVVSEHFTAFQRGQVSGYDRRLASYCFGHADLVCPVSEDLRRQLAEVAPGARYRVVPNVVDTTVFAPPPERRERFDGEPLRLLNVASLDEKKRQQDLLEAMGLLRSRGLESRLEVVGEGELLRALRDRASALGLERVVRFLGSRPPTKVAQLMRESDVFVLPSRFENLPVVLLEAMASGLPAVATAVGGVPEIVDSSSGRLVAPGDVTALAGAIGEVASSLDSFDPAALAARAASRYGIEAVGSTWSSIYEELLAG